MAIWFLVTNVKFSGYIGMSLFSHVELHGCRYRINGESDLTEANVLLGGYFEGQEKEGGWEYR